jgi:hypothetical protein
MSALTQAPRVFGINPYQYISEEQYHPLPRTIPMVLNNREIGYAEVAQDSKNNSRVLLCVFFDNQHAKQRHDGEIDFALNPQKTIIDGHEKFYFETIDFFEK